MILKPHQSRRIFSQHIPCIVSSEVLGIKLGDLLLFCFLLTNLMSVNELVNFLFFVFMKVVCNWKIHNWTHFLVR
uniref:Uncharacterized protein n=1 Tax=Physcomitrium patens TaxID=3218 RepID=A0A2K1L3J0_PHYPA|nr:hypothetical protein PHYPA_003388 [Physcomitrium patens]